MTIFCYQVSHLPCETLWHGSWCLIKWTLRCVIRGNLGNTAEIMMADGMDILHRDGKRLLATDYNIIICMCWFWKYYKDLAAREAYLSVRWSHSWAFKWNIIFKVHKSRLLRWGFRSGTLTCTSFILKLNWTLYKFYNIFKGTNIDKTYISN